MRKAAAAEPAGLQSLVAPRSSSHAGSCSSTSCRRARRTFACGPGGGSSNWALSSSSRRCTCCQTRLRARTSNGKTEIETAGGQATVFAADGVDAWSDDGLVEEFRHARQEAYAARGDRARRFFLEAQGGIASSRCSTSSTNGFCGPGHTPGQRRRPAGLRQRPRRRRSPTSACG